MMRLISSLMHFAGFAAMGIAVHEKNVPLAIAGAMAVYSVLKTNN